MHPHNRSSRRSSSESHDVLLARALRLREAIIQAVAWKRRVALCQLARSLLAFTPTRGVLKASGLGRLLHDKAVWNEADNQTKVIINRTELKWKAYIKTETGKECPAGTREVAPAFGGRRPHDILRVVDELTEWLLQVDEIGVHQRVAKTLAVALALRDVSHWSHLEGWDPEALNDCSLGPSASALWLRALEKATRSNACRRAVAFTRQARLQVSTEPSASSSSAAVEARQLHELAQNKVDFEQTVLLPDGVPLQQCLPQDVIARLGAARDRGADVGELLLHQAASLRVETQRRSLASVASGLRAWHQFAVLVLGYSPSAILPPLEGEDVEKFISIFRNGSTACNYIVYLKWICTHMKLFCRGLLQQLRRFCKARESGA